MSIYKPQGSPFYHYDFQVKCRRFHGSTGCRTKSEAKDVERYRRDEAKAIVAAENSSSAGPMTIDVAAGRFWLERGQFYKGNARQTFKRSLEWIVIKIGPERLLSEFSNRLVADLVALRRGDGVSPATVNRTVTEPLRRIMHRARDAWDQIVPKIDWGKHLLAEPQERVRELTVDEEHRLREAIRDDYRPIFEFALISGCRLREAVNLRWADVDWHSRTIVIRGKGDKTATIPITAQLRELLFPLQGRHPEALFTYTVAKSRKGARVRGEACPITYEGLKTRWRRDRSKSGVNDFRWHDNRHTAATRLLRESGNLKLVQRLLRHEDIATTVKYAHVSDEDLRLAMEQAAEKSRNKSRREALKTA
ncbi:MAG TPA: site-specific integrase [Beijerinckiaceae bacterium]|nr:site-specific integrase [Beijerinckiaceae bacterium]